MRNVAFIPAALLYALISTSCSEKNSTNNAAIKAETKTPDCSTPEKSWNGFVDSCERKSFKDMYCYLSPRNRKELLNAVLAIHFVLDMMVSDIDKEGRDSKIEEWDATAVFTRHGIRDSLDNPPKTEEDFDKLSKRIKNPALFIQEMMDLAKSKPTDGISFSGTTVKGTSIDGNNAYVILEAVDETGVKGEGKARFVKVNNRWLLDDDIMNKKKAENVKPPADKYGFKIIKMDTHSFVDNKVNYKLELDIQSGDIVDCCEADIQKALCGDGTELSYAGSSSTSHNDGYYCDIHLEHAGKNPKKMLKILEGSIDIFVCTGEKVKVKIDDILSMKNKTVNNGILEKERITLKIIGPLEGKAMRSVKYELTGDIDKVVSSRVIGRSSHGGMGGGGGGGSKSAGRMVRSESYSKPWDLGASLEITVLTGEKKRIKVPIRLKNVPIRND